MPWVFSPASLASLTEDNGHEDLLVKCVNALLVVTVALLCVPLAVPQTPTSCQITAALQVVPVSKNIFIMSIVVSTIL